VANIASLSVSIFARTSAFQKGLRGVKRSLKDLRGTVFSTGSAFLTAATGGGIAYFLQQQAEAIDKSAKLADRLGISTEQVQALGEAAQESGLDMGGLTSGIQMLMRNVGKAGGSGDPVAILTAVSDELAGVTDTATKFAVVNKLFGKSGANMLNFLDGLRGKLASAEEEGKKFGTAFSRLDAAKVEQANIAMGDLKDFITGIGMQFAIQLAPAVQAFAEMLIQSGTDGEDMGTRVSTAFQSIVEWIAKAMDYLELFKAGWAAVKSVIGTVASVIGLMISGFAHGLEFIINLIPGVEVEFTDAIDGMLNAVMDKTVDSGREFAEAMDNFTNGKNLTAARAWFDEAGKRADEIAQVTADKAKAAMGDKTGVGSLGKGITEVKKAGDFKQIDLSRTVIGGLGKGKKDPNLAENKKTNEILRSIEQKLGGSKTAAVFA